MAVTILNSLYPPQFSSTFAPAFTTTSSPRIYFSISEYNSSNDIKRVHVSIVNQSSNESAVNNSTGILFKDLQYDANYGMYYVDIAITDIKSTVVKTELDSSGNTVTTVKENSGWNYNQFYKLQLRFDNNETGVVNNSDYFITYLEHFSEWSQVLLLRPIIEPEIFVNPFDTRDNTNVLAVNKGILHISGLLQFGDGRTDETETMQSFVIQILKTNSDEVLQETERVYTANNVNPNVIDYRLDLAGLDTSTSNTFRVRITATTKNNYVTSKDYEFSIADYITEDTFNPVITVDMDNENGIANLVIKNTQGVFGTLFVRRSSSLSEFTEWELIREQIVAGQIELTIEDNTVGSGVWYRYYVQLENTVGGLTRLYYSDKFFPDFYDAILSRKNRQIAIKFNYNISSFKPVVNRQKIDTLGGRYPKFAENAAMNYKQFSVSGLISTQEDENEHFLGKEEFYGKEYENYTIYEDTEYRDEYTIENYNYFWEREFREELVKWLNDGEPKLYRSQTEGLMAVMVTDISLTPNKTLSRRLYDFSATVYEIADGNSLDTLNTLGIYDVITPETQESSGEGPDPVPEYVDVSCPGQIYSERVSEMVSGKVDIVANVILSRLQLRYGGVRSNKIPRDLYIKNVKVKFLNQPHIFLQTSNGIYLVENPNQYSEEDQKKMQLGYTFEVNNQSENPDSSSIFFVNQRGYYQIPSNINVTSLFFPQTDDMVLLEYVVCYKETNNTSTMISSSSVERTLVGQQRGIFLPYQYLGERIRKKYNYVVPGAFYQQMQWWKGMCVDVDPFALVDIMYEGEDNYTTYEVGFTGVLHMLQDTAVQDICFIGRNMHIVDSSKATFLEPWECVLDDSVDENISRQTWHLVDKTDTEQTVFIQQDAGQPTENIYDDWSSVGTYINVPSQIQDIKAPRYNTVYQAGEELYIYYINGQWYPIEFSNTNKDTMVAQVPIEGLISYYGDVIRNTYA